MMMEHSKDSPDVVSCPPLVFFGALGLGLVLDWLIPLHLFVARFWYLVGLIFGLLGTTTALWCVLTLHRAGTTVQPGNPVNALVTSGPFRYSRNPMYVAMTIIYLGVSLYMDTAWPFIMLGPALVMVYRKIILREEQFLENRFGDNYRNYKKQVRRWI